MTSKQLAAQIVHKNLETELLKYPNEVKFALEKAIELRIREYGEGLLEQFINKASFDVDKGIVIREEIKF